MESSCLDFNSLINTLPGHVAWVDKNNVILGCNEKQAKTVGCTSSKELIGRHIMEFQREDHGQLIMEVNKRVITTGKAEVAEEPYCNEKGEIIHYLSYKSPLFDDVGDIIGVLCFAFDISAQKMLENDLRHAKNAAELASKAKTEFLENMRHDIRTALNGIQGFAQLIHDMAASPQIKEYAVSLIASCKALTRVHNQILGAVRAFHGYLPLYKKKFKLKEKAQHILELNLAKSCEKGIKLVLNYDDALPPYVVGDSKRIFSIILELVANALKYTDQGEVCLNLSLVSQEGRDIVLKVEVVDTGIGIPKEKQEEIFTRFKRLTPAYEGHYSGLGLGLSIVKQFIDDIDGEIYVHSEVDQGTTFICHIPLKKALINSAEGVGEQLDYEEEEENLEFNNKTVVKKAKSANNLTATRVLVIEDQPIAAQVAEAILSSLNCKVDMAVTGEEALKKLQTENYEFIFTDIGLPDISGKEVVKNIRVNELTTGQHIPIVALTAHVDVDSKQSCLDAGIDAVLNKPLVKETAEQLLNAFIPSRVSQSKPFARKLAGSEQDSLPKIKGQVLDLQLGAKLVAADETMAKEMIHMMLDSFVEEKIALEAAIQKKDWFTVGQIAHKLRGGIAYCGTPCLQQAVGFLEDGVRLNKKESELTGLYQLFMSELEKVEKIVKKQFISL